MKTLINILRFASIILAAAFSASCVHQWPEPAEADFVLHLGFPAEMPQGPTHEINTRASKSQEDYDVRYIVEAYEKLSDGSYNETTAYARFTFTQEDVKDLDNTFELRLMEGEYRFRYGLTTSTPRPRNLSSTTPTTSATSSSSAVTNASLTRVTTTSATPSPAVWTQRSSATEVRTNHLLPQSACTALSVRSSSSPPTSTCGSQR